MKILKQGKQKEWWAGKVGACKNCGTEVQVEAGDKVNEQFDRNEPLASVTCPQCESLIWVYPASPDTPRPKSGGIGGGRP